MRTRAAKKLWRGTMRWWSRSLFASILCLSIASILIVTNSNGSDQDKELITSSVSRISRIHVQSPVLLPGAEVYYPQPNGHQHLPGDPLSQWGDVFQRITRELTTDTMEIANLDNQVFLPFQTPLTWNWNNLRHSSGCNRWSKQSTTSEQVSIGMLTWNVSSCTSDT